MSRGFGESALRESTIEQLVPLLHGRLANGHGQSICGIVLIHAASGKKTPHHTLHLMLACSSNADGRLLDFRGTVTMHGQIEKRRSQQGNASAAGQLQTGLGIAIDQTVLNRRSVWLVLFEKLLQSVVEESQACGEVFRFGRKNRTVRDMSEVSCIPRDHAPTGTQQSRVYAKNAQQGESLCRQASKKLALDFEVGGHLLYILAFFQSLQQIQQSLCLGRVRDGDGLRRTPRQRARLGRSETLRERLAQRAQGLRRTQNLRFVRANDHVFRAALDCSCKQVVLLRARRPVDQNATTPEQKRHIRQRTSVLAEQRANRRCSTVAVVGHGFDDQSRATRTIALIGYLLITCPLSLVDAFSNGALNVVLGHVGVARRLYRRAQTRILSRVRPSGLHRRRNLATETSKLTRPFLVLRTLPVHDILELRVSGHIRLLFRLVLCMQRLGCRI